MARIAIMALENLEETEAVGTDIPVEDIVDQPENDVAEMQEIATEMESGEDAIDEAVETADTMDAISGQMEETLPEGGMEPAAAAAVEVAVEHMCKRLGFSSKRSGFALEGFSDKTTRVAATKVALEGIKEFANKVWQAIVNAFNTAIQWVKTFYTKLTSSSKKFAQRAQQISEKAASLKGKVAKADSKINASSFKKQLCANSQFVEGSKLISDYKVIAGTTALKEVESKTKTLSADILGLMNSTTMGSSDFSSKLSAALSGYAKSAGIASNDKDKAVEGMSLFEEKLILGDKAIYTLTIPTSTEGDKVAELASKAKIWVASVTGTKAPEVEEVAPLTSTEIIELADAVKGHMEAITKGDASIKNIEQIQAKVQAQAKKLSTNSSITEAGAKAVKAAAATSRMLISLTTVALQQLSMHEVVTGKAALDYCAASLKAIGGADVEVTK